MNAQLWRSYNRNIDTLERLRNIAHNDLWPELHYEWLPELDRNPDFLPKFQSIVSQALRRSRFDPYLNVITNLGFNAVGGIAGAGVGTVAGQDPFTSGALGAAAGGVVRRTLEAVYGSTRKKSDNLVVFFQKAKRL